MAITAKPKKILKKPALSLLTSDERVEMFRRLADRLPEPKSELDYVNPFTLLVAVVLSAQATDVGVNKATRALFQIADTPARMVALGQAEIERHVRTIGLFRTKAKNVFALSKILVDEFHGEIPKDRETLEGLPGVGRKTANVVLNVAFGEPTLAVDTHVFRVSNRTGLAPGKTPRAVEDLLMVTVPQEYMQGAHHWLILHGRYTCKAPNPLCGKCVIVDLCRYEEKKLDPSVKSAAKPLRLQPRLRKSAETKAMKTTSLGPDSPDLRSRDSESKSGKSQDHKSGTPKARTTKSRAVKAPATRSPGKTSKDKGQA